MPRTVAIAALLALLVGAGIGFLDMRSRGDRKAQTGGQSSSVHVDAHPAQPPPTSTAQAPGSAPGVSPSPTELAAREAEREAAGKRADAGPDKRADPMPSKTIAAERERERSARLAAIAETSDHDSLLSLAGKDPQLLRKAEERLAALGFVAATAGPRTVWVRPGAGEPFRDCEACPELVAVPPPVRSAARKPVATPASTSPPQPAAPEAADAPLAVGRFEVTRDEFAAFAADSGYEMTGGCHARRPTWQLDPELSWRDPGFEQTGRHPVVCVSFENARAYVAWLNLRTGGDYRLLTEEEWDHAARSGTATALRFPFGKDDRDICAYANGADLSAAKVNPGWKVADCSDGYAATAPVGSFKPNHFGLYDMLGNVWEWVDTCPPADGRGEKPTGICTSTSPRILKGGSFSDKSDLLETSARSGAEPAVRDELVGLRVVRSLRPPAAKAGAP